MKIPIRQLETALSSINGLSAKPLPGPVYLQLVELATEIKRHVAAVAEAQRNLALAHAKRDGDKIVWLQEPDETGTGVLDIADQEAYQAEWDRLLDSAVDLDAQPLPIDALRSGGVLISDLIGLAPVLQAVDQQAGVQAVC